MTSMYIFDKEVQIYKYFAYKEGLTQKVHRILVDLYQQGENPTRSPTQRYVIW